MKWPWSQLKRSRWVRWTAGIGAALLVYTLAGFVVLPAVIHWWILKRLPAITHRTATVRQVRLNPFTLLLTIRGFELREPNGARFASFEELSGKLRFLSIFKRTWVFEEIGLTKPFGNVILQPDGRFNFTNLLTESPPPGTPPKPKRREAPRLAIERLRAEDGVLFFHDVNRKSLLKFTRIGLTLDGLSTPTDGALSTTLSFLCNGTGRVVLQGAMRPGAHSGDLQLRVTDLDLRALQPYLEEIWKLEITGGTLTATGRVQYAAAGPGTPRMQFAGELGVAHFAAVDLVAREEFLKLDSLTLNGLDLQYRPHRLNVAAINVVGLRSRVSIHADKSSNWKGLVQNAEKLHDLIVKLQLNQLFPFQLGTVSFDHGSLAFADRSIEPNVVAEIQDVAGRVTGLSSIAEATANVDLHGKVDDHSTFTISGTINPLADNLKIDLALSLKNGEMRPGSPYAAKYVGYPIHQGQLSLEAHYTVNQRALKAENKFSAHHLRLGAKSNSPDATELRVKLAIALLQDRDGLLTFEVPVNGNLDDPQFKLGPVVAQILMNLITKVVSNPFGLLGSLFGGGEQLSFVNFESGGSDFAAGETRKLDILAKALAARPALELEITGSVNTTDDRNALALSKLHQKLKAWRLLEAAGAGIATVTDDRFPIPFPGSEHLLQPLPVGAVLTNAVAAASPPGPARTKQNFEPRRPSGGPDFAEQKLTDLEARIMETIEVTPDDWRALMQARADKVRDYLRQTGQVAAERMFIVAPRPVDSLYQGQSRVDLSLQ